MNEIIVKDDIIIEDLIYEIRGKQVMLDSDLANLYECKNGTKEINQIVTSSSKGSYVGRCYLPFVFTERGVAIFSSILRTEVAKEISIEMGRWYI